MSEVSIADYYSPTNMPDTSDRYALGLSWDTLPFCVREYPGRLVAGRAGTKPRGSASAVQAKRDKAPTHPVEKAVSCSKGGGEPTLQTRSRRRSRLRSA